MRGTDVGRRYTVPIRIEPERGQVCENVAHSSNKETWHVLQQCEPGSKVANASCELGPEVPLVIGAESLSGDTPRLTRESAGDEVGSLNVAIDLGDVAEVRHVGPVLREHPACVGVDLRLPDDLHARPLKAEVDPADTGEQAADRQRHSMIPSSTAIHSGMVTNASPTG